LGSTIGEATVPVIVGVAMVATNALAFNYSILVCVLVFVSLYISVHLLVVRGHFKSHYDQAKNADAESTDIEIIITLNPFLAVGMTSEHGSESIHSA
jgi:heme/copper-type cytochrome/quinol oxidase subunit 2